MQSVKLLGSTSKGGAVAALFSASWLCLVAPDALGQSIAGRIVPSPIYGVTLDSVSNSDATVNSLAALARVPTARIVFDTGEPASYYLKPIQKFRGVAYIMGQLADSSYMRHYTVASIGTWTQNYTAALGSLVDIWEVGNEVNGNWLGSSTLAKVEAMYDIVSAQQGKTALTFFYEGEPSDPNNCIAADHGGNDMFTWIAQQFQLGVAAGQRPAETEKIRQNVNYVLVSWYPDQCPGESPNWPWVFGRLSSIFPNAKVGFGELGTANPENGSAYEISEIEQYYPMARTLPGLPASYIGGYFWWYFYEEMVPEGATVLFSVLDQALQ